MAKMTVSEIEQLMDDTFPQSRSLGWRLETVGDGAARIFFTPDDQHLRPGGTVSGPTLFALVDTAMYFALLGEIGPQALALTTSCNINFLRRAGLTDLQVDATLLKVGKRLAVGDVIVRRCDDGEVVVQASSTFSVPPRR